MIEFCYPYKITLLDKCKQIKLEIRNYTFNTEMIKKVDKGTDSIIYEVNKEQVLKIARLDTIKTMETEAKMLYYITRKTTEKISPRPYSYTKHTLLMEKITGYNLKEVIKQHKQLIDFQLVIKILTKAVILDKMHISHNELARPYKHIIIRIPDKEPIIIDFGSASIIKKPNNLTQLLSAFFFSNNQLSQTIIQRLQLNEKQLYSFKEIAKAYKKSDNQQRYDDIIKKLSEIIQN